MVTWHLKGDKNTSFFHKMVNIKSSRNLITQLSGGDDLFLDLQIIVRHATIYFTNIFCNVATCQDFPDLKYIIPTLLNNKMNSMLTSFPSLEEIKVVVFNLSSNNSHGSDGFGGIFYQTYWDLIT